MICGGSYVPVGIDVGYGQVIAHVEQLIGRDALVVASQWRLRIERLIRADH